MDFERLTQRNDETKGFLYRDILKGILTTKLKVVKNSKKLHIFLFLTGF